MQEIDAGSTTELDLVSLGRWLEEQVAGFMPPFTVSRFAAGQSNPTYRIDAQSGSYVLRRQPFGVLLPSAHAVDREFRIMRALYPMGFPVPRPLATCRDASVIGSQFYVMELVLGYMLQDGGLPRSPSATRRAVYESMTDTLAALHSIDPARAGLADYGRHGNYFQRQTARWIRQYRASETDRIDAMELLIEFLPATLPSHSQASIVHGDYRIDNLIFDDAGKVAALIDWELSTIGDPLADLSYYALNWVAPVNGRSELVGLHLQTLNIPTLEQMLERYCAATGRRSLPPLDWYFAYNLFRIASIVQGIKWRQLQGNAANEDALLMARRVPLLAAAGLRFANRAMNPND
jgi:aminoglycoside phosphotransferase (APT) family kinase protein